MKYIKKEKEPKILKEYRESTPDASCTGFIDTDNRLKKSLLSEQGHVCAYCMQRINLKKSSGKPKIEVEHILSQKDKSKKDLDYKNMLAVCNGNLGGEEHCDKSKKEHFEKKINEYSEKNKDNKYLQFYGYIIWYLNFLKNKTKYN